AMRLWIKQVTNGEIIITKLMIKEKAKDFANALNLASSALLSSLPEHRQKLHELIEKYTLENVFNADET
ncbi:8813_t:CDS:2, partial [Gigaspora rosea]